MSSPEAVSAQTVNGSRCDGGGGRAGVVATKVALGDIHAALLWPLAGAGEPSAGGRDEAYNARAVLRCKLDDHLLTKVMFSGATITESVIGPVIRCQATYKSVMGGY